MTRIYDYFKSNPSEQVVWLDKAPGLPAGSFIGVNRTKNMWMIKGAEKWRPFSEVCCPFSAGSINNLNDKTNYPLTNNKTSPTWWYSIAFPNGDIVLVDKFERLAEVQVTVPTAVSGGVQKVVQGVVSILGAVCQFDGNGDVTGFGKTGKLSDGSVIPSALPRGFKPLPYSMNVYSTSIADRSWAVPRGTGTTSKVIDNMSPTGEWTYQVGTGSYQGILLFSRNMSPLGFSDGDVIKGSFFIKNEDHTVNNKHDLYDYNGNLTLQNIVISGNNCTVEEDIPGREYTLVINDNEIHRVDFEAVINDVGTPCNVFLYNYERGGNSTGFGRYVTGVVIGHEASQPIPATTWHVERKADIPQLPIDLVDGDFSMIGKVKKSENGALNYLCRGGNYIQVVFLTTNRLRFKRRGWTLDTAVTFDDLNKEYHIGVVSKGNESKIFVDGQLVASGTNPDTTSVKPSNLILGANDESLTYQPELMPSVTIFKDKALIDAELIEITKE